MLNKPNILIINSNQFGYHTDYYYFAKYLSQNFNVHFICFDRKRKKVDLPCVNIVYLDFPRFRFIRSIYFLLKALNYINSKKFEHVFSDYFKLVIFIGLLSKSNSNILDIRSGSLIKNDFLRKVNNLSILFASKTFNKVTIISKGLAKLIGIKNYSILPLGSEVYFHGHHSFNKLNLLYVGTFIQRNIHETIEGMNLFIKENEEIEITYDIIGFGNNDDIDKLKNLIKKYKLESVVNLHGRKTKDELIPFFEKCNVGISYVPITPWFDYQPPTKTFEYVLSGMICIGTAIFENKNYINETNGILIEDNPKAFAEALETIWGMKNYYNSEQIRATLSGYTWKEIVNAKLLPILL